MHLTTSRLILRPLTDADIPEMHGLFSDPQVARFNTIGILENESETRNILAPYFDQSTSEPSSLSWVILSKDAAKFIGEIGMGLAPSRYRKAEIHYSLLPVFWGQGLATEAVQCIVDHGFNRLGLHRIEAGVAVDNLASIKLLERIGFIREGRKRQILPLKDGWSDNFHYGLLDNDPRRQAKT